MEKNKKLTHSIQVKSKIQETTDSVSLVLDIPNHLKETFQYQAGQFVSFFLNIDGENIQRSYSLCTSPLADSEFKVTVKRVKGGKGSNYLIDKIKQGDFLETTPPAGHFFKNQDVNQNQNFVLFAAGSGITPIFSILKSVLHLNEKNCVELVYCNKNLTTIIYKDSLDKLSKKFGDRLKVHHILSQPTSNWTGYCGRVSGEILSKIFDQVPVTEKIQTYLCGPEEFMGFLTLKLQELGFKKDNIHQESFGYSVPTAPTVEEKYEVLIGDLNCAKTQSKKIQYILNGEQGEIDYDGKSSVLESLIETGLNAPYSCMEGACMACLGKVKSGLVYQKDMAILAEENIEDRETLTCQAFPLSEIVQIDYDDL